MIKSSRKRGAPPLADDLEEEDRSGDIDGADEWEGPLKNIIDNHAANSNNRFDDGSGLK